MNSNTIIGSGLVCLDILMKGADNHGVSFKVGGTCGNVMMILSYMGWKSYPIARLDTTEYGEQLLADLRGNNVCEDFITSDSDGKTPVIVQRNIIDRYGNPTHKFEILNNKGRFYLDYKAVTVKQAKQLIDGLEFTPSVFFFDRISPANIQLAKAFREKGSLIYFEPSVKVIDSKFLQCVEASDIVKFADQRIADVQFTNQYTDKLFIQTLGANGLRFSLFGAEWQELPATPCDNFVDSSGAGDWTSSMLINLLQSKNEFLNLTSQKLSEMLTIAQKVASKSCSYESARGMMKHEFPQILSMLNIF